MKKKITSLVIIRRQPAFKDMAIFTFSDGSINYKVIADGNKFQEKMGAAKAKFHILNIGSQPHGEPRAIVVVAEWQGTIEKVIACQDKETADNFALEFIDKGLEVATFKSGLWNMQRYQSRGE